MKKTLLSVVVIAATVSVAYAADATDWFNGGVGAVSGGKWSSATGVSTDDGKYVLSDVESYAFTATSPKSASEAKLCFQSNVKFQYAYDALPEIGADDKAGVTVFGRGVNTNYYVLARDPDSSPETNMWVDTGVAANLVELIPVNIVISNGVHTTYAIYTINNNEKTCEIVAASKDFKVVDYSGSGVIGSLVGSFLLQGYPIPGNFVIATEAGNAWADRFGYAPDKLAAILISTATDAYGRTAAESCILGVATNEEITASIDDTGVDAEKLKFKVQLDPTKIIAGHNVQFQLKKDATGVGSAQTDLVFSPDLADGEYSIVAYIDGADKEISVSKTMGVKTAAGGFNAPAAAGFLAVPYTGAEGDIAIANLFKKAMLVERDQLDVFDSETAGWKSFTFNGTAWEGVQKNEVTPNPATTTIKRGQAFKLTRPKVDGMSAPVYLGYVSTAAAKVSIPAGQYELVSKVDGSSFALSGMADSDWGAKVDVGAAVPTEMYKKIRGWKKIVYADGKATAHDATEVNGPFFMLNRGTEAKEVDFSK